MEIDVTIGQNATRGGGTFIEVHQDHPCRISLLVNKLKIFENGKRIHHYKKIKNNEIEK